MEMQARKQRAVTSTRVDRTKPANQVVDKFGGLTRFCEICDWQLSTVHAWLVRGLIPTRVRHGISYQAYIIGKGREHGIEILPSDFIEDL